jgi:hypothetical protein
MFVERRPDSPRSPISVQDLANQSFSRRHCQSLLSGSSSQGESPSGKMGLESPGASHHHGHRILEPESPCSLHAQTSRMIPETPTCVRTGSCKRLHLSHPDLCKKIVQKARQAFSKLGRKPGSKISHNSSRRLHQDCLSYTNSVQGTNIGSNYSSSPAAFELPAGDGTPYELPAYRATAYSGTLCEAPDISVAHHEPRQTSFSGGEYIVSPVTPYHGFSGSGSEAPAT